MEERARMFVALLKRRAQRVLEEHQAPPPPVWNFSGGISEGYESNVNLDGARKGDYFTEESASVLYRPRLASWLKGDFGYDLSNTHFQEMTDSDLWSNTWKAGVQIQPHSVVRLDLGAEVGILNFPFESDNSFFDQRLKAHLFLAHTPWLTHKIGWTTQGREYDTRLVRDSDQNDVAGLNREDHRQVAQYEMQFRFPKTSARLGAEGYRNFSNEIFQEFYDWESRMLRGVLTRVLSDRWLGTLIAVAERKNYARRSVPDINVAERDNLYTAAGSLIYSWNSWGSLNLSLTYRYQDSNDPRLDFTDWIYQVGLSVDF